MDRSLLLLALLVGCTGVVCGCEQAEGQLGMCDGKPCPSQCTPPEGYTPFIDDSPGALYLFALLSRALESDGEYPNAQSWKLALEWQQDKLETFVGPDAEIAASWRVRMTDADTARKLADELSNAMPHLLVRSMDAELDLRAAETEELLDDWAGLQPCAGPY